MIEQFKRISTIAMMAGILALGGASSARADLEIQLSVDNIHWQTVDSGPSGTLITFNAGTSTTGWQQTVGINQNSGFHIQALTTASDSPGSAVFAALGGSSFALTNVTTSAKTLYIKLGDTGWMGPHSPPGFIMFDSSISGNVSNVGIRTNNLLTYESYVDPANGQNSTPAIYNNGPQTPGIVNVGGFFDDKQSTITNLTTTFSMTEFFKVQLGTHASIGFNTSTSLTLLPEPSSMAIAGLGMLGMVGYGLRWRRKGS
jgi:PEP-CTERM motif